MKVVVITGSRAWPTARECDVNAVIAHEAISHGARFILGDARGVDEIARRYCVAHRCFFERFIAREYGAWPWCGNKRNHAMVMRAMELRRLGYSAVAHAFPLPGGSGTLDCISKLEAAGIPVTVHATLAVKAVRT
jgi:hypothetical protein